MWDSDTYTYADSHLYSDGYGHSYSYVYADTNSYIHAYSDGHSYFHSNSNAYGNPADGDRH